MNQAVTFETLAVFQGAKELCLEIYRLTYSSPFSGDFALKDQVRRSSGSVMDNIAEGYERGSNKELIQFLYISKGSAGEVRSQLIRAKELGYVDQTQFDMLYNKAIQISKMLSGYIKYLKNSAYKGNKFTPS